MRVLIMSGLALIFCGSILCAAGRQQEKSNLQLSLDDPDWQRRAHAYEGVKADAETLKRADVKEELLNLLDRENQVIRKTLSDSNGKIGVSGKYGEEYSEYYSELLATVENTADWHNEHQLCVLAEGSYNPDSPFAAKLVTEGGAALAPCLLKGAQGTLSGRREAIPVLEQLAGVATLPPAIMQQVRQAVMSGLTDSDPALRQTTVEAVGRFGTQDMIPVLRKIASSDPISRPLSNGQRRFDVREAAAKAIQSIQERTRK